MAKQQKESEEDQLWLAKEETEMFGRRLSLIPPDTPSGHNRRGSSVISGGSNSRSSTIDSPTTSTPAGDLSAEYGNVRKCVDFNDVNVFLVSYLVLALTQHSNASEKHNVSSSSNEYQTSDGAFGGGQLSSSSSQAPILSCSSSGNSLTRPTAELDRSNDNVYKFMSEIVKSVKELLAGVQHDRIDSFVELVQGVGAALRGILQAVDTLMSDLPPWSHREIEMAHGVLSKDMAKLISAMKSAQKYLRTTVDAEYRRAMLEASHILVVDAKTLLDTVDAVRLHVLMDNESTPAPPNGENQRKISGTNDANHRSLSGSAQMA